MKIEKKPRGGGGACAQTKVILDIRQGKQVMASKGYVEEYTKAGTAVVLCLTQPWHGSGQVIKGVRTAFASVTTAVACQDKGLHFTGLVKTAAQTFPHVF